MAVGVGGHGLGPVRPEAREPEVSRADPREPTVADAICDRLLTGTYRIELRGSSLRRTDTRADCLPGTEATLLER